MENNHRVLDSRNLGIELDGRTALEFRSRGFLEKDYWEFRRQADEILNDRVKVDFIEGSSLLHSIGYTANSSCSVYMDPNQREFFKAPNWERKIIPLAFGADEGNIIYVAHNADTPFIKDNLVKLWEAWFEFVSKLKR
jgi:hypothetical protein